MVALIVPLGQYVRPRMFLHLDCGARAYPPRSYSVAPIWVFEGAPFGSQPGVGSVSREPAMGRLRRWLTDVGVTGFGASRSLPRVPAKVGSPKRERLLSVVGGNASSCPTAVALLLGQRCPLSGWELSFVSR